MIELPVQQRRQIQPSQLPQAEPQGPAGQTERIRDFEQRSQVGAHLAEASTQRRQVKVVTKVVGDHRDGGQPALRPS